MLSSGSDNNVMVSNHFENNSNHYDSVYAINLDVFDIGYNLRNNRIHHNNFFTNSRYNDRQAKDSSINNNWNDSFGEGNCWSDYPSIYPNAQENGTTWNLPYDLDGDSGSKDFFPLVDPVDEECHFPVAMIGIPIEINQYEILRFNGGNCYDLMCLENYTWEFQYNGVRTRLFGLSPEFTFQIAGTYAISLTVTNLQGHRDRTITMVTIRDCDPPVAEAGPDCVIEQHQTHQFDANSCRDNIGIVNYTWTFSYQDSDVKLFGISPSFTFNTVGKYVIALTVMDGNGNWAYDIVNLTVRDTIRPMADAGSDVVIDQHETIFFNASGSYDKNEIISYTWHFKYGGSEKYLHGVTCNHTFDEAGDYNVVLSVSDEEGNRAKDMMKVRVRDITPPVANAGPNITVPQGEIVRFDAINCTDNTGIINYTWSFKYENRRYSLFGIEPSFRFYIPGRYRVTLEIWDPLYLSGEDTVWVEVLDDIKPHCNAGNDVDTYPGNPILFNGSGSTDNVDIVNYAWIFFYNGKIVELYGPHPIFDFKLPGNYAVTLRVTDPDGNFEEDIMMVSVKERDDDNGNEETMPEDDIPAGLVETEPIEDDNEAVIRMVAIVAMAIIGGIVVFIYFMRKQKERTAERTPDDEYGRVEKSDMPDSEMEGENE